MRWYPANDQHAIERVAFTALLDYSPTPKGFQSLLAKIGQKATAAGINEMAVLPPPIHIQIGAQDQALGIHSPSSRLEMLAAGRSYRKTENGTVTEEIICSQTAFIFAATKYKRWAPFLDRLDQCLSEALSEIAESTNVIDIRLEYWDRFDKRSDKDLSIGSDKLIREASNLIPSFFASREGSWHTHVGFFLPDGLDRRTLVNANVDVISNSPGLPPSFSKEIDAQARIYTLASGQYTASNAGFTDWKSIKEALSVRHELLKSLLQDLIAEDLSNMISLRAEPLRR